MFIYLSIYLHTKSTQEKTTALEGAIIRLTANFSTAVTEGYKQWSGIFSELKDSSCQCRILFKMKLSFLNEDKDKDTSKNKVKRVCHWQYRSKETTKGGTLG